jgi:general secretion pathway protein D
VQDKEGKLRQIVRNTDDQIMIVPDQQTFSLIVYASRKNQEWISKLIMTLDRRRPQVLIDVTLVEIRKTDEFNYDLNMVTSLPNLVQTGGQTGSFYAGDKTVVEGLLEPGAPSQFADLQVNAGDATGFYADIHVNALLRAMQQKNYGRVLAKPKVLVNDNETGTIKTTDTTYVIKKTSIPVTSGSAGSQNTLIETAIDYSPYDAGITLEITPHISAGQLLRLDINLTRSDFTLVTGEKPPDQTSSDINTVVTVPDGSTIILGGMLRLNQSKGGKKVPILGDLPIIGLPFRSVANSDIQSKLYVFVKAEVIRPSQTSGAASRDLERISEQNRAAFEEHEEEFQTYQDWPGVKPKPVEPESVLEAQ